jgi:membrane protease YdiL (CAAX protease family)
MKQHEPSPSIAQIARTADRKATVILLAAPVLMTVFRYWGGKPFYLRHIASALVIAHNAELTAGLYVFASAFVLLGLIPLLIVKLAFRERLSDCGVQLGDWSFTWKALAVVAPVMVLLSLPASRSPDFLAEYPLTGAGYTGALRFAGHALAYLFFYMGWEFCFRGFVQFGLRSALGDWNAILVQTLASCLLHIGKPMGETLGAILGGLAWGIIAFRSRSLLCPLLTHWLLGLSLDFFIIYL